MRDTLPSSVDLGPFYTTMEKCTGWSRDSTQDMVIKGKGWCAGEVEKTKQVEFSRL